MAEEDRRNDDKEIVPDEGGGNRVGPASGPRAAIAKAVLISTRYCIQMIDYTSTLSRCRARSR